MSEPIGCHSRNAQPHWQNCERAHLNDAPSVCHCEDKCANRRLDQSPEIKLIRQVQNAKLPASHRPVLNEINAYLLGMRTLAAGASTSLLPLGNTASSVIFIRGEWSINCSHTAMTPAATAEPVSSASDSCKHPPGHAAFRCKRTACKNAHV